MLCMLFSNSCLWRVKALSFEVREALCQNNTYNFNKFKFVFKFTF